MSEYTIILFYNYVRIEDPEKLMYEQRALCDSLGLKGRIIVAHEGVNVTLEGATRAIESYCAALLADPRFADTHIKRSVGTGKAFPKLSVKVRKEIVSLGLPAAKDIDPRETTGKYVSADELHAWMAEKENGNSSEDFVIVDMRNDYEHASGHFKGSVLPPLHHFRDLPKILPTLEHLKNKKIVTVCTGGVRCEKASGFLVKNGFKDVYQLKGGIVTYMEKYENAAASEAAPTPAQNFLGSLYVFDDRVTMAFADAKLGQRPLIGTCELCGDPSEKYVNCADGQCHRHFIVCEKCFSEGLYCRAGGHENNHVHNYAGTRVELS
jgi:UPF0176 protein